MTPAMQAARDRVVNASVDFLPKVRAARAAFDGERLDAERLMEIAGIAQAEWYAATSALLALEAQEKEQADAEG